MSWRQKGERTGVDDTEFRDPKYPRSIVDNRRKVILNAHLAGARSVKYCHHGLLNNSQKL
jgi:hypothetical protein